MASSAVVSRSDLVRRGLRLEYFTVAWNTLEALASLVAGLIAGSIALVAFGADSLIEVASGAALLWRLRYDFDSTRRERVERVTLRAMGASFVALALYVLYESGSALLLHEAPRPSVLGITVAFASLIAMPLLARAKRRVAVGIGSEALHADSRQADFCACLSAILLGGLLLNALFGWWWADPIAGLIMVPIIGNEGVNGLRGKDCCRDCVHD